MQCPVPVSFTTQRMAATDHWEREEVASLHHACLQRSPLGYPIQSLNENR